MDCLQDILDDYVRRVEKLRGIGRHAVGFVVLIVCYYDLVISGSTIPNYKSIQRAETIYLTAATKKSSLKLAHPLCRKLSSAGDGSER
jgi:hypothetical protein